MFSGVGCGMPKNIRLTLGKDEIVNLRLQRHANHWSADLAEERSRRGEHAVPQRFGLEPAAVLAPQKAVVRIDLPRLFVSADSADLLIGVREDHQAVEVLERPAGTHELGRQPVEEFGMA